MFVAPVPLCCPRALKYGLVRGTVMGPGTGEEGLQIIHTVSP